MEKTAAVEMLGQNALLRPSWMALALKANDRLKLYLTVLQSAAAHARQPEQAIPDLQRDIDAAGIPPGELGPWLRDLPGVSEIHGQGMELPGWPKLAALLRDDLRMMARPVLTQGEGLAEIGAGARDTFAARAAHWDAWLSTQASSALGWEDLAALTRGDPKAGDSLHLLVMDLHKAINHLVAQLAVETIEGAQVWGLNAMDKPLVAAFMRGIHRTAPLKMDHPGLDTVATRDGDRLLIQNDIGTNDVHVLVIAVEGLRITLTYSDLHAVRFAFFQDLLTDIGAQWSVSTRQTPGLNADDTYQVGTATVDATDTAALATALESVAARIVFLIDWNRARKRLQAFVDKKQAVAVLAAAARREVGHIPWLRAGGEQLVWEAMAAQGPEVFRLGDRLDAVLGEQAAGDFLLQLLELATQSVQRRQPVALVQDEARLLLARLLRSHGHAFDLLADHAAYCQALAEAVDDALAHGLERDAAAAAALATRAKIWERRADHLVMQARASARQQPQGQAYVTLLERADDVADALEEGVFLLSLIADGHAQDWGDAVRAALGALAQAVAGAAQDHVRLVSILRGLDASSDAADHEDFLAASWRVLQSERRCDELLRAARRALSRDVNAPAALMLANDFAAALEQASDVLLALAYAMREQAFARAQVPV
ncbi:hypothetical protein GALL_181020 [mine drainage metagenome]|uniref:Phosphate transport regulator n=1 Tax=mine drainage metagenome TaxID=410659 RepID=A0A1J5S736_9ZZZZ